MRWLKLKPARTCTCMALSLDKMAKGDLVPLSFTRSRIMVDGLNNTNRVRKPLKFGTQHVYWENTCLPT